MTLTVTPVVTAVAVAPKTLAVTVNGAASNTVTTTSKIVEILTQVTSTEVAVVQSDTNLVTVGIQGPAGEGIAAPPYRAYDDYSEPNTYYKGWSNSLDRSTATWRILKGEEVSPGNYIESLANGDDFLDKIWDNRLSLIYS